MIIYSINLIQSHVQLELTINPFDVVVLISQLLVDLDLLLRTLVDIRPSFDHVFLLLQLALLVLHLLLLALLPLVLDLRQSVALPHVLHDLLAESVDLRTVGGILIFLELRLQGGLQVQELRSVVGCELLLKLAHARGETLEVKALPFLFHFN